MVGLIAHCAAQDLTVPAEPWMIVKSAQPPCPPELWELHHLVLVRAWEGTVPQHQGCRKLTLGELPSTRIKAMYAPCCCRVQQVVLGLNLHAVDLVESQAHNPIIQQSDKILACTVR